MITIGLLKADVVDDEFKARFGDYTDMIEAFLRNEDDWFKLRVYELLDDEHPNNIEECDAYLISGSRKSVFDDCDWIIRLLDFVRELDARKRKLVGLCFGHQLVAAAMGGEVVRHEKGWGAGAQEYRCIAIREWMHEEHLSVRLLCSHQDQVTVIPRGAEVYLSNQFCQYAGIMMEDHIFTMQPHPEFVSGFAECLIHRREEELGVIYEPALSSLAEELNVDVASAWIQGFLTN